MAAGFLSNISIRSKLLFIVVVPIVAMIVLAGIKISILQNQYKTQSDLTELMEISVAASNLVHELQKERGASAGFTSSKGQKFADVLPKQRLNTDEKRGVLKDVLASINTEPFGAEYNKQLKEALSDLDKIEGMRSQVSSLGLPIAQVVGYYTGMNAKFLNITKKALFVAQDPKLLRDISAYLYFTQSKERAGIERAVGATGFGSGWTMPLLNKLRGLVLVQDTYIDVFLAYATSEEKSFYNKKISDPSFSEVQRMRDVAFKSAGVVGPLSQTVDSGDWFKTITNKINILKKIEDHLAHDVTDLAAAGADAALTERNFYLTILAVLVSAVLVLTYIILTDLLISIKNTRTVMEELSGGNDTVEVFGTDRKDEIGGMARSIEVFKQGVTERKKMEAQAAETEARAEEEKRVAMQKLADDFDSQVGGMINSLAAASTQLRSTAENMRAIADETQKSSESVAATSQQSSANVNSVSAAMEEMTAASTEISSQITNAKTRSNDTAQNAEGANETVSNLNELVENIGEVVTSIQDIAEQTNLLALNATIEAARAGEAGKGFAVVAEEVKKLATETSNKTDEINTRITEIQEATRDSVEAMKRIIGNISEIDQSITGVSAAVEEQNATTGEVTRSISEASQGTAQVASIIQEVQKGASETGTSADAVLGAAKEVSDLSETLKGSVDQFLNKIRGDSSNQGSNTKDDSMSMAA